MHDRLEFDPERVKNVVLEMKEKNEQNKKNMQLFLAHVDNELSNAWQTTGGQEAIAELKKFVNENFQEYINYLDARIDQLENVVIPALNNIKYS